MKLRDYLRSLRKHWLVVTACTLAGVLAALGLTLMQSPVYAATARLFLSVQLTGQDTSGLAQGGQFTQQRVKSYADIIDSPQVAAAVIAQLNLPDTPEQLSKKVTASSPLDTVLLDVSVRDGSPTRARDVANAVAAQFGRLVTELETPPGAAVSPVKVSVVRPATLPTTPAAPNRSLNLALGLLIGVSLGAGGAVLRDSLDTSITDPDSLSARTGVFTLGAIGNDPEASERPLIVAAHPQSPRAEAFRQLRTNLQFTDVDNPPRSIVVTSSVPSEGKSTTTCNLAITMVSAGMRVALVDGDLRRPQVATYLGLEGSVGLTSVLVGQVALDDALQVWGEVGALHVLPAGAAPPNPSELLGSQAMSDLLHTLEDRYDLVIVDSPPLLPVTDAAVLATIASGCLLLVRYGRTRQEQLDRALESLRAVGAQLFGVVLNMTPTKGPGAYRYGYGSGYRPETYAADRDPPAVPEPRTPVRPLRRDSSAASGRGRGRRRT